MYYYLLNGSLQLDRIGIRWYNNNISRHVLIRLHVVRIVRIPVIAVILLHVDGELVQLGSRVVVGLRR